MRTLLACFFNRLVMYPNIYDGFRCRFAYNRRVSYWPRQMSALYDSSSGFHSSYSVRSSDDDTFCPSEYLFFAISSIVLSHSLNAHANVTYTTIDFLVNHFCSDVFGILVNERSRTCRGLYPVKHCHHLLSFPQCEHTHLAIATFAA